MANLLNKVQKTGQGTGLRLISSTTDPRAITGVQGTTGDKILDLAFTTANKIVSGLTDTKRRNEIAKLNIEASKNTKDYEATWDGRNKFAKDSFEEYQTGLTAIQEKNKMLASESKYMDANDINSWNNSTELDNNNKNFTVQGSKSQYDIKETIDDTQINITGLMDTYAVTGDETNKADAMVLFDSLKSFLPEVKVEGMKIDAMVKADNRNMEREMTNIINDPDLTVEEKRLKIGQFKEGIEHDSIVEADVSTLVSDKLLDPKYKDSYVQQRKASTLEFISGKEGLINRLQDQVTDQEYRNSQKVDSAKRQLETNYMNDSVRIDSNIRSGNYSIAISEVEDKSYTPKDIMESPSLTNKYFKKSTKEMVANGEYFQPFSTTETSRMRKEISANAESGQTRAMSVTSIMDNINSYEDVDSKENVNRALIARKVISSADIGLFNTAPDVLNKIYIGKGTKLANGINYFEVDKNSDMMIKINQLGLTPHQRDLLTQAMVGSLDELGWSSQVKLSGSSFNKAYNEDSDFRNAFDNIGGDIRDNVKDIKIREVKADREAFRGALDNKYSKKGITIKTEKGYEDVDVYKDGYTDSIFD